MGTIQHHAIIVTSFSDNYSGIAMSKAIEVFGADRVSCFTYPDANYYISFMVGPDGSKEYWEVSDTNNELRRDYMEWLRTFEGKSYINAIEVTWGELGSAIVEYEDDAT